ncbi:MAG TPA: DUF488 family protein [Pirellulaceae bacterium]|nr:DUF488 family protein [Pirellulaceae bacterium]
MTLSWSKRYRGEIGKTDARQTIQLLAEMAHRTPISIGCYCGNESRCHRSVLRSLIREGAGLLPELPLSEFCIYTIRHRDDLSDAFESVEPTVWEEGRAWTQGRSLLDAAQRDNTRLPIILRMPLILRV